MISVEKLYNDDFSIPGSHTKPVRVLQWGAHMYGRINDPNIMVDEAYGDSVGKAALVEAGSGMDGAEKEDEKRDGILSMFLVLKDTNVHASPRVDYMAIP